MSKLLAIGEHEICNAIRNVKQLCKRKTYSNETFNVIKLYESKSIYPFFTSF